MQNDQSAKRGASGQRGRRKQQGGNVLSLQQQRGDSFRRVIVAAASLRGIYTDDGLADAAGVSRGTVRGWWMGAIPKAETVPGIVDATGLDRQEIIDWVYYDGPTPRLPQPEEAEGHRLADEAARALQEPVNDGSRAKPPAPHETTGSGQ